MKFLIIIILSLNTSLIAQNIDRVNVYIIPIETSYVTEKNITPNYVRSHSCYEISITSKSKVKEFFNQFYLIKKEHTVTEENNSGCRIVIDFIASSKIEESLVIDKSFSFSYDEPYSKVKFYKYDVNFLCYLKNTFPSFIDFLPKDVSCR